MKFTSLDFETANRSRTSVCSVGATVFEDGEEVDSFYSLVKPTPCRFDYFCTRVHGISYADVADAPTFGEIYGRLRPLLGGYVVCHNAPFDIGCLRSLVDCLGIEPPDCRVLCTLKISRRLLSLPDNRLDTVAEHLGVGAFCHHDSLEDARACGEIFQRLLDRYSDALLDFAGEF
mgnify:CR=1 FL=1